MSGALRVITLSSSGDAMERTDARVANRPEERWELIMKTLKGSRLQLDDYIEVVDQALTIPQPLEEALDSIISEVHHPDFIEFLHGAYADWAKQGCDVDFADENGYLVPYHFSNRLAFGPCRDGKSYHNTGYFCTDRTTPLGPQTVAMARLSAACALRAAQVLLESKCRVVYACNLHPGHHAGKSNFGGYCYLNNAAVAVASLRKVYDKVAVIDIDYHHGNGTQEIFYDRDDVFTASLHITPDVDYPFFSGYVTETGAAGGLGYNMNAPLPAGTSLPKYSEALELVLRKVQDVGSQALVVAFGGDTLLSDPDANPNGGLALEVPDYQVLGKTIASLNLPTVVTQEGGYHMQFIGAIVESFLRGFLI